MAKAKVIENLDCEAEALSGIRLVLYTRFGEMYDLRGAALDFTDIEGVHDMRVASRRLRSAIKDFRVYFGGKKSVPKRGLKEVADALGDVRDQDVAIVALEKMRAEAEADAEVAGGVAAGIGHLADERRALRQAVRVKLAFKLAERPLADLRSKFLSRLVKPEDDTSAAGGAGSKRRRESKRGVSFREAGREVIGARVVELKKLSNCLHHPSQNDPLHRMRIAAKRLRYAMELFAPCWGGTLTTLAQEVSELQSSLGELHDCDVWIDDLGARLDRKGSGYADGWAGAPGTREQTRRAAVWLLSHFTKERSKHFREALARWEEWETTGFFAQLDSILNEAGETTSVSVAAVDQEASSTHAAG
ncbi:MAG TPA: CHAD domain-containing protein [Pyrinomonadaceae bacterium]|jgi:CHAD domain-containing protein|nr:CHAD domain-containing protein [Pyrinomonadaceae bacterium]